MHGDAKKLLSAAVFTVMLVVLINLAWWVFYDRTEDMLDRQLGRRLETIAATGASLLDPGVVEGLTQDNFEAYFLVSDLLEDIRSSSSFSELFIVDEKLNYLATTSVTEDSSYFLAALYLPYINGLFFGTIEGPVATPSYRTGDIYLKSAFMPLYDSTGFVVAVLGVEADVDYTDALTDLRSNLYYATGLSVAAGLVMGGLFLLALRRINRMQQQLFMGQTQSFMGRMVAVVSHEIKNPLSIIRASAERLRKKQHTPESEFIVEEVDRLNDIVTSYLEFASGAGDSLVNREDTAPVNLAELIGGLHKHLEETFPDDEIKWEPTKIPPDLTLVSYRRSLRQVLLNLLFNAVQACRDAGCRPVQVGVAVRAGDNEYDIVVFDRGPGMTARQVQRAFEPFYTTRQSGSGLGLYLSKKIVEEMGGKLFIVSEAGKVTEAIVRLPNRLR